MPWIHFPGGERVALRVLTDDKVTHAGFTTGLTFTVLASTKAALLLDAWSDLGPATETPPGSGQFQFTDSQATNYPQRYDRVQSP